MEFDERYGLKLIIEDLDPSYTIGKIELKRQAILKALLKKGLLDLNNRLIIAPVIQRIAVLSSPHAAGLQDYLDQLNNNDYGYQFLNQLFPAAMQRPKSRGRNFKTTKKIERIKENFDVVIIIRGGGSKLDLSAFDSYELGAAIAQFPLPVFTGIGHEIDETILDKVAHTALKTPTAVADHFIIGCCSMNPLFWNMVTLLKTPPRNLPKHKSQILIFIKK